MVHTGGSLTPTSAASATGVDGGLLHRAAAEVHHQPIWRLLLAKNGALLVIVGLPTLVLTAVMTVVQENPQRLVVTLPDVLLPIWAWLGVGNVVSVLLPVAVVPLRRRWSQRHDRRRTVRWVWHLALPYALWCPVDPVGEAPRAVLGRQLNHVLGPDVRSLLQALLGLAIWIVGTWVAVVLVRHRGTAAALKLADR